MGNFTGKKSELTDEAVTILQPTCFSSQQQIKHCVFLHNATLLEIKRTVLQFALFWANLQIGFQPYLLVSVASFMGQSHPPQRCRCGLPPGSNCSSSVSVFHTSYCVFQKAFRGEGGERGKTERKEKKMEKQKQQQKKNKKSPRKHLDQLSTVSYFYLACHINPLLIFCNFPMGLKECYSKAYV